MAFVLQESDLAAKRIVASETARKRREAVRKIRILKAGREVKDAIEYNQEYTREHSSEGQAQRRAAVLASKLEKPSVGKPDVSMTDVVDTQTAGVDPDAQKAFAEARYRASVGTATRHEVKRHLRAQGQVEDDKLLVPDPDGVLSLFAQDGAETVPIMVGGIKGLSPLQELVSFEGLSDSHPQVDPLEDPILGENNVDDALEAGRRARHVASAHLSVGWLNYGLTRAEA